MAKILCSHTWALDLVSLPYILLFVQVPFCFSYYGYVNHLNIYSGNHPRIGPSAQDCLGYLDILCVHMIFRIGFSVSVMIEVEILIATILNQ